MNKNLLNSFMAKKGETQNDMATLLGISLSRVNAKINENGAQFNQTEIALLKKHYNLSPVDIDLIFFTI
jgi:plasmid maintenance system antidote protein VapI